MFIGLTLQLDVQCGLRLFALVCSRQVIVTLSSLVSQRNVLTVCKSCRLNGFNEYFKTTTQVVVFKQACNPPASFPWCSPSSLVVFSCDLLPFHICLHVFSLPFCLLSLAQHPLLFLVMLAPCRSSSMPSLTCLRTAVMKILRRRRILQGFSLVPGTPLHGVCAHARLCVLAQSCVHCMFQWDQEAYH